LAALPPSLTITASLGAGVLEQMWELHDLFRTLLATDTTDSNRWVFAAKLCARKRPNLFPVRDSQVCGYLSGYKALGAGPAGSDAAANFDLQVDDEPLRLLDACCRQSHSHPVTTPLDPSFGANFSICRL
jgi:hypothetical protein